MASSSYPVRIGARLALIFLLMLALILVLTGKAGDMLFLPLGLATLLGLAIAELFLRIRRTNQILSQLLDAIHYGDPQTRIEEKASGLGFDRLARSARSITEALASAQVEKETRSHYLQSLLDHVQVGVLTLNRFQEPELINPTALRCLGIRNNPRPHWKDIEKAAPLFAEAIRAMGDHGRGMVSLTENGEAGPILVQKDTVRIGDHPVHMIILQNIDPEMDRKELESWQSISRVMAHEIMNSLTPLSSLTETGLLMLEEEGRVKSVESLSQKTIDTLHQAIRTIHDRNEALRRFIRSYRRLSRLPAPDLRLVALEGLLRHVEVLFRDDLEREGIALSLQSLPARYGIHADEGQIKQVLINLIQNAREALPGTPRPHIRIRAKRVLDEVILEISDNGPGIPRDQIDKVFIPFYSTKQGGSGIGLGLCRQIVRNHEGRIILDPGSNEGTRIVLAFPLVELTSLPGLLPDPEKQTSPEEWKSESD
ncbi:MAG: ATP-binding protein [Bacteroidales bacterium]